MTIATRTKKVENVGVPVCYAYDCPSLLEACASEKREAASPGLRVAHEQEVVRTAP
jgi:hypothetical protein